MIAEGKTATEIGERLGVDAETVRKFARKRGTEIRREPMTMERHPSWRGGAVLDRSGYLLRRVLRDGPYGYLIRALAKRGPSGTDPSGYAPEHRIVMHCHLGRRLEPGEVIDHIDGNRLNNDLANLRLFPSNAEHLRVTLKGRVPNWSPEGRARMTGRPRKNTSPAGQPEPISPPSKSDDPA
jgi:hypothetical protein